MALPSPGEAGVNGLLTPKRLKLQRWAPMGDGMEEKKREEEWWCGVK